jgi:hypothetical protein
MSVSDLTTASHRLESYIVHYAGTLGGGGYSNSIRENAALSSKLVIENNRVVDATDALIGLMQQDLKDWQNFKKQHYHVRKKYKISIGGGLGDQIDAEPVVREIRRLHPHDHLIVSTHWPELFQDLEYPVEEVVNMRTHLTTAEMAGVFHTYAPPTTDIWKFLTHAMMNSTDFSSYLALQRELPPEKKQIKIRYREDQKISMLTKLGTTEAQLKNAVVLHAGTSWLTKTIRKEIWNGLISALHAQGEQIVLIGKSGEYLGPKRGSDHIGLVEDLEIPEGVLDARNKLSVKESLALLDCSEILVSNDSGPIHLAGATDIWIIGIFTAKHPNFVLPYRNGTQNYKTVECNFRPSCWPCGSNDVKTKQLACRIDHCSNFDNQYACHPDVQKMLDSIKLCRKDS